MATAPLVLITGTVSNPDGSPYSGPIDFRQPIVLRHSDGTVILSGRRRTVVTGGALAISLPYVDSAGWSPAGGWSYEVFMPHGSMVSRYSIAPATAGGPHQDLGDLMHPGYKPAPGEQYASASHSHPDLQAEIDALEAEVEAGGGAVTSVAGRTGAVVLAATDVGLGNVNNTADLAKPVSTATATALGAKADASAVTAALSGKADVTSLAPVATAGTYASLTGKPTLAAVATSGAYTDLTGKPTLATVAGTGAYADLTGKPTIPSQYTDAQASAAAPVQSVAGRTGAVTLGKTDVGLPNVDNTADTAKPVSTAQATAIGLKFDKTGGTVSGDLAVTGFTGVHGLEVGNDLQVDGYGSFAGGASFGGDIAAVNMHVTNSLVVDGGSTVPTATPGTATTQIASTAFAGAAATAAATPKVDKATLTTKGDLYVATAAGTITRLAAGSDGQALVADSTQAAGLKYATVSGGGGTGDLVGPAGATDNAVVRFDTTTGKLVQDSLLQLNDAGALVLTPIGAQAYVRGQLYYDNVNECLTFNNNDSNISMQIGQEIWVRVWNSTGSTITNGAPVYASGYDATSGYPTVALASASGILAAAFLGCVTESIANGASGWVTVLGVVNGVNTASLTAGSPIYISTTAGVLSNSPATAPNYRLQVGVALTNSSTVGKLFVRPAGMADIGFGTANQLIGMNSGASGREMKTLNGTANQITVTHAANAVTLSLPTAAIVTDRLNYLTTGEEVMPREIVAGETSLVSGTIHWSYFTARKTETITQLRTASGGTAASGLTLARIGIYSTNGTTLTLVASIASDTTLWTAANTLYTKTLSASWSKVLGTRYAVAFLAVGTTMPTVEGAQVRPNSSRLAPFICGDLSGQTDLPATTQLESALGNSFKRFQAVFLP